MNEDIAFEINELQETIRKKKFELASCSNGLFITKMIVGGAIAATFSIF